MGHAPHPARTSGKEMEWLRGSFVPLGRRPRADRAQLAVFPPSRGGQYFRARCTSIHCAAGRADLCAIARPHLAHPCVTLAKRLRMDFLNQWWPEPYRSGQAQLERAAERGRLREVRFGAAANTAAAVRSSPARPAGIGASVRAIAVRSRPRVVMLAHCGYGSSAVGGTKSTVRIRFCAKLPMSSKRESVDAACLHPPDTVRPH